MPQSTERSVGQQTASRCAAVSSDRAERVYMLLELRKVFQTHHKFPTAFIYPMGRLCFEGIAYSGSNTKFMVTKESIKETWKIKVDDGTFFEDSFCHSLGDVLCKYFKKH